MWFWENGWFLVPSSWKDWHITAKFCWIYLKVCNDKSLLWIVKHVEIVVIKFQWEISIWNWINPNNVSPIMDLICIYFRLPIMKYRNCVTRTWQWIQINWITFLLIFNFFTFFLLSHAHCFGFRDTKAASYPIVIFLFFFFFYRCICFTQIRIVLTCFCSDF